MLIVGAKGHAVEVLQCLAAAERAQGLVFYDDVSADLPDLVLDCYPLLTTAAAAQAYLATTDARFVLGLGGPTLRQQLATQFRQWGGVLTSVVADTAVVGPHVRGLMPGLNVMHHALVAI